MPFEPRSQLECLSVILAMALIVGLFLLINDIRKKSNPTIATKPPDPDKPQVGTLYNFPDGYNDCPSQVLIKNVDDDGRSVLAQVIVHLEPGSKVTNISRFRFPSNGYIADSGFMIVYEIGGHIKTLTWDIGPGYPPHLHGDWRIRISEIEVN